MLMKKILLRHLNNLLTDKREKLKKINIDSGYSLDAITAFEMETQIKLLNEIIAMVESENLVD